MRGAPLGRGLRAGRAEVPVATRPQPAPASPIPTTSPTRTRVVVVEATVLDPVGEKPVELGPLETEEAAICPTTPTEGVRGVLDLTRQRYGFLRSPGSRQRR